MPEMQIVTCAGAWAELSEVAWRVRDHAALVVSDTKVGCCILVQDGNGYVRVGGCNVEHPFLSTSIHAEANAIGSMITNFGPEARAIKILVAARRGKFLPCGQCMDMIIQYGGPTCEVGYQNKPSGPIRWALARHLMPEYPE